MKGAMLPTPIVEASLSTLAAAWVRLERELGLASMLLPRCDALLPAAGRRWLGDAATPQGMSGHVRAPTHEVLPAPMCGSLKCTLAPTTASGPGLAIWQNAWEVCPT